MRKQTGGNPIESFTVYCKFIASTMEYALIIPSLLSAISWLLSKCDKESPKCPLGWSFRRIPIGLTPLTSWIGYQLTALLLQGLPFIPCGRLLERCRFHRRSRQLIWLVQLIRQVMNERISSNEIVIMASFPLPLCPPVCNYRATMFKEWAGIGYNTFKQMWF